MSGKLIIADGISYSLNDLKTKLNNNCLIVGASGTGKTRGIVIPNILECEGSYIVSDPKGELYRKYSMYLQDHGYTVKRIDFTKPEESDHWNPLDFVETPEEIQALAHDLVYTPEHEAGTHRDPFWDESGVLLLSALIGFVKENFGTYTEKKALP